MENEGDTVRALKALSLKTEGKNGWAFEVPSDLAAPGVLMKSIVGFEIAVTTMSAKLKLSQNKSSTDFEAVISGLATRKDEQSAGVLEWMRRLAKLS